MFDITKLRYERVIIMTDADVDGSHIRTLLLTLFYRYLPEIIKQRHLFIAQPPLYQIKRGKDVRYVFTDEEKERVIAEFQAKAGKKIEVKETEEGEEEKTEGDEKIAGIHIQRYKGLGEMNPEQLWDTTMNPATRMMKEVAIEDAAQADEIFTILMGSEVSSRKRFIQTHAKTVKNLDI